MRRKDRLMQRMLTGVIVLVSINTSCAWPQHNKDPVIGTWKLISLDHRRTGGEVFYPMGPMPSVGSPTAQTVAWRSKS
jgi:hypothetical protein